MDRHQAAYPIEAMCRVLEVSASGYHAWKKRPPCKRKTADERLRELIIAIHRFSRGTYGAPRILAELRDTHKVNCSEKRVARLMRQLGLQGVHRRRFIHTTQRSPAAESAPDLVNRNFKVTGPGQLLVADFTYVLTWAGFLYVAVVLDAYTRVVAGWSMANHMRAELVDEALKMAMARGRAPRGAIHHSDHGSQYTSVAYGKRIREAGLLKSMGTRGDALDNALCEAYFATLECELLDRTTFRDRDAARLAIFDFIECWYNPFRRHSSIGMISPLQFERRSGALHA